MAQDNETLRLVKGHDESVEEADLAEQARNSERESGESNRRGVADARELHGDRKVACDLLSSRCAAEGIPGSFPQVHAEERGQLVTENGVVGPGVNQSENPGRGLAVAQDDRNDGTAVVCEVGKRFRMRGGNPGVTEPQFHHGRS